MPDHIHAILTISDPDSPCHPADMNANFTIAKGTAPQSLSSVIQSYKSVATRKINSAQENRGSRIWHRNYYEHVIRNEYELDKIREYIENNPFHPEAENVWWATSMYEQSLAHQFIFAFCKGEASGIQAVLYRPTQFPEASPHRVVA